MLPWGNKKNHLKIVPAPAQAGILIHHIWPKQNCTELLLVLRILNSHPPKLLAAISI
jgi:hypothetical protein